MQDKMHRYADTGKIEQKKAKQSNWKQATVTARQHKFLVLINKRSSVACRCKAQNEESAENPELTYVCFGPKTLLARGLEILSCHVQVGLIILIKFLPL